MNEAAWHSAAAWCTAHLPDPPSVALRAARRGDADGIARLRRSSFGYASAPAEAPALGRTSTALALRRSVPVGYVTVQARRDGSLYIYEMGCRPPAGQRPVAGVGPLLLAACARLAIEAGWVELCANVAWRDDPPRSPGRRQALVVEHCRRHGLPPSARRGLLLGGRAPPAEAAWLAAPPPGRPVRADAQARFTHRGMIRCRKTASASPRRRRPTSPT